MYQLDQIPTNSADELTGDSVELKESSVDLQPDNEPLEKVQPVTQELIKETVVAMEKPKKKRFTFKKKGKKDEFTNEAEIPDARAPKIRSLHPIFGIVRFDWFFVVIAMIAGAGMGTIPLLSQYVFGQLLNGISPVKNANGDFVPYPPGYSIPAVVATYALYMALLAIGNGLFTFLSQFFGNFVKERMAVRFKQAYFNALLKQEMGYFDIKKTGKILSSLQEDILNIQEGFSIKLAGLCQNTAQFIVGVIIAFTSSWKMSIVMLAAGIGSMTIIILVVIVVAGILIKKIQDLVGSSVTTATEVIGSIRTVRSMAGEDREQRRYKNDLDKINFAAFFLSLFLGIGVGGIMFSMWACSALAIWYGGTLVVAGELQAGSLFLVFSNILFAVLGISGAMTELQAFLKAANSAKEILMVTERVPAIPTEGGRRLEKVVGEIEFKDVNFAYPSRPDTIVLKNFSLSIKSGQHIALVGESGSGKSTLTGLVERFYDPLNGSVLIDGVDVKELDTDWLHKNIAIVTQEPVLFACSIRKNITYAVGDENVNMDQVIEAAKTANAHDFISSLPDGYDTLVGERGVSMSGGQKQRIAIARAMLQNSHILILDEATSALDTEAESLVQAALDRLMVGKTSIVIAHRLSTVKDCDLIVVMKSGEAVEMGTHDDLLKNTNGLYYKLALKQMSYSSGQEGAVQITEED